MTSTVTKLGAAILAGVIPFAQGCIGNKSPEKSVVSQESDFKVPHLNQFLHFEKDRYGHDLSWIDVKKELGDLGLSDSDTLDLALFSVRFNAKTKLISLKNEKIEIEYLSSPTPLPQGIDFIGDAIKQKMFGVLTPLDAIHSTPFEELNLEGLPSDILITPSASTNNSKKILPVSITLKDRFKFVRNSIGLAHYVHNVDRGSKTIEEGIYFQIMEDPEKDLEVSVFHTIVPKTNLPLIIVTEDTMYIIGLDEFKKEKR